MRPLSMLSRRRLGALAASLAGSVLLPRKVLAGDDRRDDLVGAIAYYVTEGDETLLDVARARNLGVPEISAANPAIDPWLPGKETLITLPSAFILPDAPREGIVINYADLRLYYFPKSRPVETYAIGVGRDGFELKFGQTRIVRKQTKPTWYPTASTLRDKPWVGTVVPAGPDNPLGEYALYLGWPTYLIHGTNKPYGVGRRVSRGCIRMYPEGVERLFAEVPVGTKVTAVEQFVKLGWHRGELYLEVQPDTLQVDELEEAQTMTVRPPEGNFHQQILDRAGPDAARIDWQRVEAELSARTGMPMQITRPRPPGDAAISAADPPTAAPLSIVSGIY